MKSGGMDIHGLFDDRNINLWNTLNSVWEIDIQKEQRKDYLAYSRNSKTIIYVPVDNINPASFTHELLHVYMKTKGVFISGGLILSLKSSQKLSKLFSGKLIEHIGNCLEHIKMLPIFVKLGYDPREFLSDSLVNKLTGEDVLKIKRNFVKGRPFYKIYSASAIDYYIGKYFAAIACPINASDYTPQLAQLKAIDQELYGILEDFTTAWINFDYDNPDPIEGSYSGILYDYTYKLEKWTTGKTIR